MPNPATYVTPGDVTAPSVPPAPVVVPYGKGLQVSVVGYTPPTDFFRYRYFKNSTLWRESPTLSQIDFDVSYGVTYQYTVAAIDTALPANVSAQSGIGSGTPSPYKTPDIDDDAVTTPKIIANAVTGVSYQILNPVAQTRDATQAEIAIPGLSVSRNISGSSGVLVTFSGLWTIVNTDTLVVTAGPGVNLYRDATLISGGAYGGSLAPTPGPGHAGQVTIVVPVVDFPGSGVHAWTVKWLVQSTNISQFVRATCERVFLEVVELKR